jgi:hypothetical protein
MEIAYHLVSLLVCDLGEQLLLDEGIDWWEKGEEERIKGWEVWRLEVRNTSTEIGKTPYKDDPPVACHRLLFPLNHLV